MNVMKKAWEIARKGQEKFGGNAKEYFAYSLKLAWGEKRQFEGTKENTRKMLVEFKELSLEAKKINPGTQVIDVEEVMSHVTYENVNQFYNYAHDKLIQAEMFVKQLKSA